MEHLNSTSRSRAARAGSVLVVLAVALVVRLYVLDRAEAVAPDSAIHLAMARELGTAPTGEVLRGYDYHPGYPAMVSLAARLSGARSPESRIAAAQAVSLAMGVLALVCVYALARATFGYPVALLALPAVALGPRLTELSCSPLSDAPALAFSLAAVVFGIHAGRRMRRASPRAVTLAAGAGLAAGLGYLIRPEAMLAAGIAVLMLLPLGRVRKGARGISAISLVVLAVAAAVCVAPYAATIGGFTQKKSPDDFVGAASAGTALLATVSAQPSTPRAFWQVLDRGRAAMGTGVFVLTGVFWLTAVVHYALRIRLPRGILIRPRRDAAIAAVVGVVVMLFVLTALELQLADGGRYVSSRHMLLTAMLVAPGAGAGVAILAGWAVVLTRRLGPAAGPPATLLCIAGVFGALATEALPVLHADKAPYRLAGRAAWHALGDDAAGLTSHVRVPLYAGSPPEQFRRERIGRYRIRPQDLRSPEALMRRAEHAGNIAYVAIDRPMLEKSPNADIIPQLVDDPRFDQLGVYGVGEPSEVHVFLLPGAWNVPAE